MERYEEFKNEFLTKCKDNIHRQGIDKLLNYLSKSDFFVAPASSKYHCNYKGGLCEHSLNVYRRLVKECINEFGEDYVSKKMETITIVSLFHDICKANFYVEAERNVKDENGKWVKVPFYKINEDKFVIGHSEESVITILRCMQLTSEEIACINAHMGFTDNRYKGGDYSIINSAFSKSKLALLTHISDMKATNIDEVKI